MDLEFHQLDLRYEALRKRQPRKERVLLARGAPALASSVKVNTVPVLAEIDKLAARQPKAVAPATMAALVLLAIPPLRRAVEKDLGNPSFHYHLGQAYAQTGDKAAARLALERALKLKPDFDGAEDARKVLETLQ